METENNLQNKGVQTLTQDMVEVLEKNEGGLIKKIISEEENRETAQKAAFLFTRKNKIFLALSLLFLALTFVVLYFFASPKKDVEKINTLPSFVPLIFTEKNSFIEVLELPKGEIARKILEELSVSDVKEGGVAVVYLTENNKVIGISRFLEIIKANLAREKFNIFEDNFLIGAVNQKDKDLFFLLKFRSFADVFREMRIWEEKMFEDFYDFFGVEIDASTNYLLTKDFEDGIVQNKNARILYDDKGEVVLMYVFIDENSVIITAAESATSEVMLRLDSGKIKK